MYTDESLIAFCQRALQTPSFSGRERQMAELMKDKMLELGFDEAVFDRLGNVIGTIHGKRPGKTILMDGHIDTVDVIDEAQWTHGPFSGEIADGKIYGRGASDMKGSDCAMITAAARYAEKTGKDFAGKICVSCTVHEECFEGVSSREITRLAKPDFVIIGEATTTTVKRGQRGRAEIVGIINTLAEASHAQSDTTALLEKYPQINVLLAFNEPTSVGAANAVESLGLSEDVFLVGFDSNVATVDGLQEGSVDALIVQNPYAMGYLGVESAYKLLSGQGSSLERTVDTSTKIVDRRNLFTMDSQKALFAFEQRTVE